MFQAQGVLELAEHTDEFHALFVPDDPKEILDGVAWKTVIVVSVGDSQKSGIVVDVNCKHGRTGTIFFRWAAKPETKQ